jgi:protein-disulfide isomerase
VVAAQAPTPALTTDQRSEFERWWDLQDKVEMPYSKEGARVLIVKFNDYQCPPCKQTYYAFEPILARYKSSDVKYLMKHYPLDPKCNAAVGSLVHPAACEAAATAVMARSKGTVDKLTAWFFAHQDELSPATVRTAAKEVGGITDFDSQYAAAIQVVKAEAAEGAALGAVSTPTFFINGRRLKGGLPPQYFEAAIEIELKRAK